MPKQTTPLIERADARARFLDNVIPFVRDQVEAFEAGARRDSTTDPGNCRRIAEEGRAVLKSLEGRRDRARAAVRKGGRK